MSTRVEYRHGVSPDAIADLPDGCATAVVTDPPYGTGNGIHQYGRRHRWGVPSGHQFIANDTDLGALASVAPTIARLLAPYGVAMIFCAPSLLRAEDHLVDAGLQIVLGGLVWDKGAPGISHRIRYAHEHVIVAAKADPFETREPIISPLRFSRVQFTEHPNEKPVDLLRALIRWACPNGGLVVDPFAGIASCGVAALAERCSYIGVECDERWWPIAERRLAQAQDRPHPLLPPSLFDGTEAA